jgi:cyclohexadienyl dehydratase
MNRSITVFLIIILVLFASTAWAKGPSRLHQILANGVLRVGTTGDWNPMTVRDPATNTYKGFDIEMVTALAADLGVKLKFVPTDWKTLVNGIIANKYDVSTSASITPARIKTVGFTKTYYQVGSVPMTLKSSAGRFRSWKDINHRDVTVAVTLGTSFEQQVKEFFPNARIRSVESPARDFQEVLSRRAEVSITSNLEASTLIRTHPQLVIVPVERPRKPADLALIVAQNDQLWLNYLNHWITIKTNQGFFDRLQEKWMPTN